MRNNSAMYIMVKFGDNKDLICNPNCSVVNLLASIKRRTGFTDKDLVIDLSDHTGLVKELDGKFEDYATKYLGSEGTFVLLEKQTTSPDNLDTTFSQQIRYIPLLNEPDKFLPNFEVRVQTPEISVMRKKKKSIHPKDASSPAGRKDRRSMRGRKNSSDVSPGRLSKR